MPVQEPVTLQEAKTQCRVEFDTDDELLCSYITAARQWAEGFLNLPLVYDSDDEEVDPPIKVKRTWKQAILLVIGHWYSNRENAVAGGMVEIPLGAKDLLWLDRNVPV